MVFNRLRRRLKGAKSEEAKVKVQPIIFKSKFEIDFSKLEEKQDDQHFGLPAVALVHNRSCIRMNPFIFPRGITGRTRERVEGCHFGLILVDFIKPVRDGKLDFELWVKNTSGGTQLLVSRSLVWPKTKELSTSTAFTESPIGTSPSDLKAKGFVLPGDKMELLIEFTVTEEFFDLQPLLEPIPAPRLGVSQMLYNDITENSEGDRKSLVDFTIVSEDGKRFPCHRTVLAMSSEYFRNVVFGKNETIPPNTVEKKFTELGEERMASLAIHLTKTEATLEKTETMLPFDGEIVQELLHWLYCGGQSANFPESDVEKVVAAADFLLLPEIPQSCEKSLVMTTTVSNALERLLTAKKLGMKVLKNRAMVMAVEDPDVQEKAEAIGSSCVKELFSFMQETLRASKTS